MTDNHYRLSLLKARQDWQRADPLQAAARAGAAYVALPDGAQVSLAYYGRPYRIAHPTGPITEAESGREADPVTQILLLHYLLTADGALPTGEWVAFHELPDGRIYQAAFEQRALRTLSAAFGADQSAFVRAALSLGGQPMRLGDASFWFQALPRLAVAATLWLGEEDLPGEANILFDSAAGHYLPTEDLSGIGGMLSGRLIRAAARS
jgi:hypothetical protein